MWVTLASAGMHCLHKHNPLLPQCPQLWPLDPSKPNSLQRGTLAAQCYASAGDRGKEWDIV